MDENTEARPQTIRQFLLADVLTITTGRLLSRSGIDAVYQILNFMTRDDLFTRQLPRAMDACKPWLIRQHPWLDGPEMQFEVAALGEMLTTESGKADPALLIMGWVVSRSAQHGWPEALEVERLPGDDWRSVDPLTELEGLVGRERIIVVDPEQSDAA